MFYCYDCFRASAKDTWCPDHPNAGNIDGEQAALEAARKKSEQVFDVIEKLAAELKKQKNVVKLFEVVGCHKCPYVKTSQTLGTRDGTDYHCSLTGTKIVGYIEWPSELERIVGAFPLNCPLPTKKEGE